MIDALAPYPEYRESGTLWVGDIPAHWGTAPNRAIFTEVRDRGFSGEDMLSVTITRGIIKQSALLQSTSKRDSSRQDKSTYKLVQPGDLAYNKMRAWQGALGISALRGIVSPAYVVMRPRADSLLPSYCHYLYRTLAFAKEAERWSYGITSDMWSLRPEHFKVVYSPLPPPDEQAAIVRFLDWATRRIDRAIRAKRKLVALVTEQKQAVIHRAVTRGLDPHAPLKPSGIPWLGEIPAHWEVRRLRASVLGCFNGIWGDNPDGQDDLWCVRVADFDRHMLRVSTHKMTMRSIPQSARNRRVLRRGDLLLEKSGGGDKLPVGAVVLYDYDQPAVCSNFVARMPVAPDYVPAFLAYLHSTIYRQRITLLSVKQTTGIQNLDGSSYLAELAAFPPRDEQTAIVAHLDAATRDLDATIARTQRQIDLLREYRARLVADVVTGKLDVRAAAAALPDEAPDDGEPLAPDNDDADDDDVDATDAPDEG